jgi:alkanesulfonate monooxygenase SsuD/methylene tetrahydromethanopterin reductase-like flavin-dependent oxidoreductase (luciferase family)
MRVVSLRLGIVILPEYPWAQARPIWMAAEEYGFAHAWTYDHLSWRTLADGPWFAALPTLTAAAAVTERIRLGTMVTSPNYRHPVPLAKDLMTLDDVSAGRLLVGMGAGGVGFDATVLGGEVLPPSKRAERFEEFVELLDSLLTNLRTDYYGDHFKAVDARMIPGPQQQPRPPFIVAANGPRLMRLAARFGQGWVTTGMTEGADGLTKWWDGVATVSALFTETLTAAGRPTDDVDRYLMVDSSGQAALSSVAFFEDCVGRATELGFTDLLIHWPRADGVYAASTAVLDEVAARMSSP